MTVLFECVHQGERHFGCAVPVAGAPLHLYPLGDEDLRARLLAAGISADLAVDGDGAAALVAALTEGRERRTVPAAERDTVTFRPPLLPESLGDALVSGFMQTHNVKADETTQSQPNWFFKGLGETLKVPGEPLAVPPDAVAVCEEAEVVLVYVTDERGVPRYVGYTFGNDLTDIGRFKRHNGHLSYAKLCDSGVAPWLFLDAPPESVTGRVRVERDGAQAWEGTFTTGTKALYYGLPDMMSELFSYTPLRHPGRVHYVYIGADRSSFHAGFRMADRDRVEIGFDTHEVTLTNTVTWV
ncbi:FAH family protein [Streptomyces sp. NBC_00872]|uniref:FAH family protein n=1 Tax=Streptomyces sp. NBC_00872 TaxID=2903686 RepID=UPI003864DAC5|nr:FAH family protein [Streptomyces sp. NBC_00872]